jgi:lipoate-protein ligase A
MAEKWRIIELQEKSACLNMGIDNAIMDGVKSGTSDPTIRFYNWKPPAVSIGCFQSMRDEVNVDVCKKNGIDVVRRLTGGGAVYHDKELTYSIIGSVDLFPRGIIESYKQICGYIQYGLSILGIDSAFAPINDIVVEGKKISGNAQTRREGVLLQHGTVIYDFEPEKMFGVLNVSKEKISDKMIKNAKDRVTSVLEHSNVSLEELHLALLRGFCKGRDYYIGDLSADEERAALNYSNEKYSSESWNFSR